MTVKDVETVAIVGGGPSGAISLSSLIDEGKFKITLFERKPDFGGTWRNDQSSDGKHVIPGATFDQLDPPSTIPKGISENVDIETKHIQDKWIGSPAVYNTLRTNVPERIMAFSDSKHFPYLDKPDQDELTKRDSIEKYVVDYVKRFENLNNVELKLNTSVEQIIELPNKKFEITYKTRKGDKDIWSIKTFDSVIVATGHYNVPKIPKVKGLDEVFSKTPNKIIHSKGFQPDSSFKDKKVIVIGSRSSSVDTVRELKPYTNDISWSVRITNTGFNAHSYDDSKLGKRTPRYDIIKEYRYDSDDNLIVEFEDGKIIENPDYIIYATGYHFSFPFLLKQYPNLINQGVVINDTYQHTFKISNPLLIFVGTPIDGMSFRVFEIQAILVARYLNGKVTLPSIKEQIDWFNDRVKRIGINRHFHSTINDPGALAYIDELIQLGGGYNKINGSGRDFPKFSEKDLEVYEDNKAKLVERWSNV